MARLQAGQNNSLASKSSKSFCCSGGIIRIGSPQACLASQIRILPKFWLSSNSRIAPDRILDAFADHFYHVDAADFMALRLRIGHKQAHKMEALVSFEFPGVHDKRAPATGPPARPPTLH